MKLLRELFLHFNIQYFCNCLVSTMEYILHLETATRNCSVAIAKKGQLIACKEIAEQGYTHAEKLHVFIEEIIRECNISISDLSAVAVSQGPGSYTGLRIGVSAAKGLCYALNIPLIAIDTLEVLAREVRLNQNEVVIPMIDARRMECYTAIYDQNYNQIRKVIAEIISEELYADYDKKIHLVGDGATKCKEVLTDIKFIYHDNIVFPSATKMVEIAYQKFTNSDFVDVAYFEPFYLKEFLLNK